MTVDAVALRVQGWCMRHGVPRFHGCLWDRDCRAEGCPPRIAVMTARTMLWVDLPSYRTEWVFDGVNAKRWHWPEFGYHRHPTGHALSGRLKGESDAYPAGYPGP
jgi:hypothetical protein